MKNTLFERVVVSPPKVSAPLTQTHGSAMEVFKDSYFVEFLDLPDKNLLRQKLHEFYLQNARDEGRDA